MYYNKDNKKPGCVYCIKCNVNNRVYIGQTRNISRRINTHKSMLIKGKHTNKNIQKDFNKYGINNFKFYIIEDNIPSDILIERETYWIKYYGGIEHNGTYNMQDLTNINQQVKDSIGNSNTGKHRTDDFKLKESLNKQLLYNSLEGDEIKEKIRNSLQTYFNSSEGIELRNKLSNYAKHNYSGKNNPMYGKKHTEYSKKLMSENRRNCGVPWNKGKKGLYTHTEEVKEKLRISSTKYTKEFIEELKQKYNELGSYSAVASVYSMNPLCVSRLIRFGSTKYPNNYRCND